MLVPQFGRSAVAYECVSCFDWLPSLEVVMEFCAICLFLLILKILLHAVF